MDRRYDVRWIFVGRTDHDFPWMLDRCSLDFRWMDFLKADIPQGTHLLTVMLGIIFCCCQGVTNVSTLAQEQTSPEVWLKVSALLASRS